MDDLSPEEIDAVANAMGNEVPSEGATATLPEDDVRSNGAPLSPAEPARQPAAAGMAHPEVAKAQFMQLEELAEASELPAQSLDRLQDLKIKIEVILGRARLPLEEVLKLSPGSLVELDRLASDPVEVLANGKLIAHAEIVIVEESFGIKIIDIVGTEKKLSVLK